MGGSQFHTELGSRIFDAIHWLVNEVEATWRLMNWGLMVLARRRTQAAIEAFRPDVVVSTYPASTLVLGELRARGLLSVPAVSAITDLAALRSWTHPAVDLNLITHPESTAEVRGLAPASEIRAVSGFTSPGFERERDQAAAREALDLPAAGPVIVVSGGGWAVGDLEGAISVALATPGATVVCLAGRNEEVRGALEAAFAGEPRARVLGFTDRIAELFAAADVLVHSTAGLTVLEALITRLPGDLLRLGPRPRPGEQPRLHALRPRPGRDGPRAAAGGAAARPREPSPAGALAGRAPAGGGERLRARGLMGRRKAT